MAIKSDLLDEINGAVEGAGLRTSVVDVSPMALYNAYRAGRESPLEPLRSPAPSNPRTTSTSPMSKAPGRTGTLPETLS